MKNISNKIIVIYFVSVVISSFTNFSIAVINDKIFLENAQINMANEIINSKDFDLSKFIKDGEQPIELETKWPWYSLIFYYGLYSMYWFLFGQLSCKYLKIKHNIIYVVPILTSLIFTDIFFPLYILASYMGGRFFLVQGIRK